jgi:ubiquitin-protein ligase
MTIRESPRIRRLRTDLRNLEQLRRDSSLFDYVAYGNPPERYEVTFLGSGLRLSEDQSRVEIQGIHRVEIRLGANYPRAMPELAWRTPIFHPNISAIGMVCLGGYGQFWVPSLQLDELCVMLWDMVRFENYDVSSPYNRSAADWARSQTQFVFPLDPRSLRDRVTRQPGAAANPAQTGGPPAGVPVIPPPPHPDAEMAQVMRAIGPTATAAPAGLGLPPRLSGGSPGVAPAVPIPPVGSAGQAGSIRQPPAAGGGEVVFLDESPGRRTPPPDGDIVFIE